MTHTFWSSQITLRRFQRNPRHATPLLPSLSAAIRVCLIVRWHTPACDTGIAGFILRWATETIAIARRLSPLEASMTDRAQPEITPNTPLRLADAVKIAFPMGGMTVAGLRRERDRD